MNTSFKVLQITDTHIVSDPKTESYGVNPWQTLNKVLQLILANQENPDFLLLTGDLSSDYTAASYQHVKTAIAKLSTTAYSIAGNHDDKATLTAEMNDGIFKPDKIIHRDNWCFILLDSCIPKENEGFITKEEFNFLRRALEENKDKQIVVVLHHHPIKLNAFMDRYILTNADEFLEIINSYDNVRIVLFGHIHQEFSTVINGKHFIGTPSTSFQVSPSIETFSQDMQQPGYRVFEFDGNGYKTTVKRVSN